MEICFVCIGNASRSPMAEAIARRELEKMGIQWKVYSRGINAVEGESVSRRAESVCNEIGLTLKGMKRRQLNSEIIDENTIFAAMEPEHIIKLRELYGISEDRIYLLGNGIADPRDCDLDIYRLCRDKLLVEVHNLINILTNTMCENKPKED